MNDVADAAMWPTLVEGEISPNEVLRDIVQKGFNATLVNPTSVIYLDIFRLYSKTKFLLTIREIEEAFVKSWK